MIAYVNDSAGGIQAAARETGMQVGQFFSPTSRRYKLVVPEIPYIVDNGCFVGFRQGVEMGTFPYLIARLRKERDKCRFVTVPDAYGSAIETRAIWDERKELFPYLAGWPLAYVAQPGAVGTIPWRSINALFVGGPDAWQLSEACATVIRAAKIRGLWVHVGRLNEPTRLRHFSKLGVDSFDGLALTGRGRKEQRIALAQAWADLCGSPAPTPLFQEAA
ncbi:MAG: hypothetical protein Rubg2KO_15180 [Rubricoccaceae bacterium]